MKLSAFFVAKASAMAMNYNNAHMEYCNCANFQWPTREEHFHARWLVPYLLINNSYNVVAIELQLMIVFLVSQARQLQTISMPTVYGDCKPVFFLHEFSHGDGYTR